MDKITNNRVYEDLFILDKMPTSCLLCLDGDLDELGHIIPKFAIRWLKRESKLEKFYFNNDPERMVPDTPAFKMMCKNCEDKFSTYEKHFTDKYYKLYYRGKQPHPLQGEVYNFAISVAWRLIVSTERLKSTAPNEKSFKHIYSHSEEQARNFLMGNSDKCDLSVYVLPIDELLRNTPSHLVDDKVLKISIRQGLKAHHLFDDTGGMQLTHTHVFSIFFKIGCYYFFVFPKGYFIGSTFSVNGIKASACYDLYDVKYTQDFLGLMDWLMDDRLYEIDISSIPRKNYERRHALTLWRSLLQNSQ
ncbi:hypothetical protein KIH32_01335 [Pseudomonas fluorescens]|uniref:hypothetical protein n=1 Tax=Pseudomonas fluorescens TaxID=294 RepID=UPI001BDB5963|nr:hypothetical protein [Pseudomonas fluorescens]MBT0622533.1 hypothetical protein [Pseudomonas fluorescens]